MISFKVLKPQDSFQYFIQISLLNIKNKKLFGCFKYFNKKIYKSDFKILQNNFECHNIIFFDLEKPIGACTHYKPKSHLLTAGYPESIGNLLFSDQIKDDQLKNCGQILQNLFSNNDVLLPLNGSFNLGFYENPNDQLQTSFLTTAYNKQVSDFFKTNVDIFIKCRTGHALTLDLNDKTIHKIQVELSKLQSESFTTRNFSKLNFFNDLKIYNQLVNESMKKHFLFFYIDWKSMKQLMWPLLLFINPKYFKFILKDNIEIGLVFAIPDYNEILSDSKSDIGNVLSCFFSRNWLKKARIIYSCLRPEFQGQKLIKIARHQVLIALFQDGYTSVESSYIDQENKNSLGNVISTGAKLKQDYYLYKIHSKAN